jgi:hypothetical protein
MQYALQRSVRIGLFSLLISFASGTSASLAQSGSTGGSIGNDEKSLSGSRASPRAVEHERPARRSKPRAESEEPRRAARKSGGGGGRDNFDGVWVVTATGCGSTTTSTIVVTSGKIIGEGVRGTISPNGVSHAVGNYNGVTVTSTGRASGRSGTGTFRTSDGCSGTLTSSKQ